MKKLRFLLLFAALGLLVGCNTFEKRLTQRPGVFESLDADTQAKIRAGIIDIGYTADMVFLAIGNPDSRSDHITATERKKVWIYNAYHRDYHGVQHVGYHRYLRYNPVAKTYYPIYVPIMADVYSDRIELRLRVVFEDGKVSQIEQVI
ncbi:hypothetical protein AXK12_02910 [Cephaloticoccus capnophilus]|uniref:Uncharacterized protein n=1 Tax=Cephaloticoccus capnophilus TaxID=1548208 RepID=A0A139SQA7_9BACT|nr:hypothetical protein [Cephaloticoccus capnophilus]KXU36722.1 hypothetical protein AXK12_02910 [Cephaloticoccus capnophilus]